MIGEAKGNSEIAVIPNKYKDSFNNLIDSSNTESPDWLDSPDWPELINKRLRNALRSRGGSPTLSKEDRLDEDVPLEPAPKIRAFQVYEHYDIAPFGLKSERA